MLLTHPRRSNLVLCFLPLLLLAISVPAMAQQTFRDLLPEPRTPDELSDYQRKLLAITLDWIRGVESTPGTSVNLREIMRTNDGGIAVQYHVFLKGAPKDQLYNLLTWPITEVEPSRTVDGLRLANDGLVMCAGRTPEECQSPLGKDDPVEFTFSFPGKGEIIREALISADNRTRIFFAVVPNPLLNKDKGCSLEAVRLTPQFEITMIRGKGYKPNETLHFIYKSYDEIHDIPVNADSNGELVFSVSPFIKGKYTGTGEAKLKGANCAPAVSFNWGK